MTKRFRSNVLKSIFALVTVTGSVHGQGTASGFLTINNERFEVSSASAMIVPDPFNKNKLQVRIVLADKPIPPGILDDEAAVWDLKSKGIHGLEISISEDKSNYSLFVISSTLKGQSISLSGTFDAKQLSAFTKQRVQGAMEAKPDKIGETGFSYSVKFDTPIVAGEAPPTAADKTAAAGKESTKAYLEWVAAIRTGDKQKIMDMAPAEKRAMIDRPDFGKVLEMVQAMTPTKIEVLKATETGDQAKLIARGISDGNPQRGKIYLNRTNGKWILQTESWGSE
jgi:hypothetical protein